MKQSNVDLLAEYLLSHEDDISFGINDFDCLRPVFLDLFGVEAQKDERNEDDLKGLMVEAMVNMSYHD